MKKRAHDEDSGATLQILALFCLVFLVNAGSLRIVWMDWCNLNAYEGLHGLGGLRQLVSNEWQASPRVQCLTWVLQAALLKLFGRHAFPFFAVSFACHAGAALMIYRLTRAEAWGEDAARAAAAWYLAFPTCAVALFVINNSFFVLAAAAAVLTACLLRFPLRDRAADAAAVSGAALASQFLGEQTIPALYLLLAVFGVREVRAHGTRHAAIRVGIPAALCFVALAVYYPLAVKPYSGGYPLRWDLGVIRKIAGQFALFHWQALDFSSWMYGGLSVRPSFGSALLLPALAGALWGLFPKRPPEREAGPGGARGCLLFLAAAFAALTLPVFLSALSGYRTHFEPRYLYCSGAVLAVALPLAIQQATRGRAAARRRIFLGGSLYVSLLTAYDLRDIWGAQTELDRRIWEAIDPALHPGIEFVATDGLQKAQLFPFTRANAISDFHEEFGARCRIKAVKGLGITVLRRPLGRHWEQALVAGYRDPPRLVPKGKVLPVVFRYKTSYYDMLHGGLRVFPDFDEYAEFRKAEGLIPFQDSP